MNAKEIQDMAYKAKFWTADTSFGGVCWMGYHAELQRFAALVAAHEREEFAIHAVDIARRAILAATIRARKQT